FLIGSRGSGKSTVARILAQALGWDWLDADEELENRHGQSIRAIFAAEGEAGFRDKESVILADVCRLRRHIIATGGGVVLRSGNREQMRRSGRVVWLTADVETLWQRLQADGSTAERRPALSVGGRAEIEEVVRLREPLYRQCADFVVESTARSAAEVAAELLRWMASGGRKPPDSSFQRESEGLRPPLADGDAECFTSG
ncbi:MAG: shikimate kinase, partial [Gemmataceae bacterium]